MLEAAWSRRRVERRLHAAYAGGLLSDDTFAARIEDTLRSRLLDPIALIGDLTLRQKPRLWDRLDAALRTALARFPKSDGSRTSDPVLLALDWSGAQPELLVGRDGACDVVLDHETVSRQHARLLFRDGRWIIRDLQSTNGTLLNGRYVGRCQLLPGDELAVGAAYLKID